MDLATLGFLAVGVFLALILLTRTPVLVALLLVPVVSALLGGFAGQLGGMSLDGLRTVVPVVVMIAFAVLYFGLMIDVGLFEPMILTGLVRNDPVRLCLVSAALPMMVALDGDGSTTFLVSVTALLPVHRRMRLQPLVLPAIVALAAGVMNILPWGGPTARAMTVLNRDTADLFLPIVPPMLTGIAWVFAAAWWLGRGERRRLAALDTGALELQPPSTEVAARADTAVPKWLFLVNALLTVLLVALLFQDLYAKRIGLPALPASLLFMLAFAIALPVNRRTLSAQQEQLARHAPNVVLVATIMFAAGVFTGVLKGTGMLEAMARALAAAIPAAMAPWLSTLVAVTSMPLSLVFSPDAFYFGVLPVFAETATAIGNDPATIGRAALLGQMTTGFPLSPLAPATFVLLGLSGVSLRDHQLFTFKWAFGTTLVMTVVAHLAGVL
jgi:CitMHS family citrate-Mg2+:H+ or citrate-Ca2+:H+ symporter